MAPLLFAPAAHIQILPILETAKRPWSGAGRDEACMPPLTATVFLRRADGTIVSRRATDPSNVGELSVLQYPLVRVLGTLGHAISWARRLCTFRERRAGDAPASDAVTTSAIKSSWDRLRRHAPHVRHG